MGIAHFGQEHPVCIGTAAEHEITFALAPLDLSATSAAVLRYSRETRSDSVTQSTSRSARFQLDFVNKRIKKLPVAPRETKRKKSAGKKRGE